MGECHCHPRVLADFYTNANAADGALTQVATDIETAYSGFYSACSDFVPMLGAPYTSIRKLQTDNQTLNGFALDVANAFIAASGGHLDINTMGPEVVLNGDSAEIEARVPEVSADRVRAEQDRLAIEHALGTDDEEALNEAMAVALEHSGNGDNEAYSATLVILLGKDNIDRVLDSVDYVSHTYTRSLDEEDVAAIAHPMAIILQSATRSGNPQARAIADSYITEARNVERGGYMGPEFDPPEARRRLGLLLTAGTGEADWVARAADVMLLGDGAGNSPDTVYFNEVALRALGANDEASYVYLTSEDLISPQDERLLELLNADVQLSSGPGNYGPNVAGRLQFNELAGDVLESGLVQYPERFGDPLTTPAVAAEAARAAGVYAEIVNIVGNDADGNPFAGPEELDDPLRNSLARIGSSTWMMDRIGRDAAGGTAADMGPPPPGTIDSIEILDDFYTELIKSDEALETLQVGSSAYVTSSFSSMVGGLNGDLAIDAALNRGEVPISSDSLPVMDGSVAQVTALARAINGNELTAADAANESARWLGALTEGGVGAAGAVPVLSVPAALLAPLTSAGVNSLLEGPSETLGAGGSLVVETTEASVGVIHAAVLNDPRFANLPLEARENIVNELYDHFTGRFGFMLGIGEVNEPRG